jgi:amino acid transporter
VTMGAGDAAIGRRVEAGQIPVRVVPAKVGLLPLIGLMFFTVSGGPYGLEDIVSTSGPGLALLLILVIPIIWSVPAALMTAELSTAIPAEGGYYQWVKAALGEFGGYLCGAWSWLTTWVDMAIYPVLFAEYLAFYLPIIEERAVDVPIIGTVLYLKWFVALAVIWPLSLLNIRGARTVGESSNAFGIFVLAPFAVIIVLGLAQIITDGEEVWKPFTPEATGVVSASAAGLWILMWNYLGWDGLSTIAGEIHDPKKTFPKLLAITVPLVTAIYFFSILAGLAGGTNWEAWTAGYFSTVADNLAGPFVAGWLTIGGLVSAAGLYAALLVSVSRVPYVLADDGWLPNWLTVRHRTYGTPWVAIVFCSAIYSLFSLSAFADLVVVDVFLYSLALMLEFVALIVLRIKLPNMARPFRVRGGWFVIALITVLPAAIIGFAVYQNTVDSGISSLYMSFAAALIPFLAWYPLKKLVKRDTPTKNVPVSLEDGTVVELGGSRGAPAVEMGS